MSIRIRKSSATTLTPGGPQEVMITHLDDSIALGNGAELLTSTETFFDGEDRVALDVSVVAGVVSGSFSQSGLFNGIRTTSMVVTENPSPVPASAFSGRNTISIRVMGNSAVYFGGLTVTAANGYPKLYLEELAMDIKDDMAVLLYAVCASGQTSEIRIIEIA